MSEHRRREPRAVGTVVMWEVRAADGRRDDLVEYVLANADPAAAVYRSAEGEPRVVVIDPTGRGVPAVPEELVVRPPHAWSFEQVR
jgi:hypothetical protein